MPPGSRWPDLLAEALALIGQVNAKHPIIEHWTLGGGTALMLALDHRDSYDIDIFLDDPQVLGFLNPETQDFRFDLGLPVHRPAGEQAVRFAFDGIGEIDFIVAFPVLATPSESRTLLGHRVTIDTAFEVIAKKVFYRGTHLQPRDLFDIAATAEALGSDRVVEALSNNPDAAAAAARKVRSMDRGSMTDLISQLDLRDWARPLAAHAAAITLSLLDRAAEESG
jgi:hypothetical protein